MSTYRWMPTAAAAMAIFIAPNVALADTILTYDFLPNSAVTFSQVGGGVTPETFSGSFVYDVSTSNLVSNNVTSSGPLALGNITPSIVTPLSTSLQLFLNNNGTANTLNLATAPALQTSPGMYDFTTIGSYNHWSEGIFSGTWIPTQVSGGLLITGQSAPSPTPGGGLLSLIILSCAGLWSRREWARQVLLR